MMSNQVENARNYCSLLCIGKCQCCDGYGRVWREQKSLGAYLPAVYTKRDIYTDISEYSPFTNAQNPTDSLVGYRFGVNYMC